MRSTAWQTAGETQEHLLGVSDRSARGWIRNVSGLAGRSVLHIPSNAFLVPKSLRAVRVWRTWLCFRETVLMDPNVRISHSFHMLQNSLDLWGELFKRVRTIVNMQATQIQAASWMWPLGHRVPKTCSFSVYIHILLYTHPQTTLYINIFYYSVFNIINSLHYSLFYMINIPHSKYSYIHTL